MAASKSLKSIPNRIDKAMFAVKSIFLCQWFCFINNLNGTDVLNIRANVYYVTSITKSGCCLVSQTSEGILNISTEHIMTPVEWYDNSDELILRVVIFLYLICSFFFFIFSLGDGSFLSFSYFLDLVAYLGVLRNMFGKFLRKVLQRSTFSG